MKSVICIVFVILNRWFPLQHRLWLSQFIVFIWWPWLWSLLYSGIYRAKLQSNEEIVSTQLYVMLNPAKSSYIYISDALECCWPVYIHNIRYRKQSRLLLYVYNITAEEEKNQTPQRVIIYECIARYLYTHQQSVVWWSRIHFGAQQQRVYIYIYIYTVLWLNSYIEWHAIFPSRRPWQPDTARTNRYCLSAAAHKDMYTQRNICGAYRVSRPKTVQLRFQQKCWLPMDSTSWWAPSYLDCCVLLRILFLLINMRSNTGK